MYPKKRLEYNLNYKNFMRISEFNYLFTGNDVHAQMFFSNIWLVGILCCIEFLVNCMQEYKIWLFAKESSTFVFLIPSYHANV